MPKTAREAYHEQLAAMDKARKEADAKAKKDAETKKPAEQA